MSWAPVCSTQFETCIHPCHRSPDTENRPYKLHIHVPIAYASPTRLIPSQMSRDWLAYHCSLTRAANDASVLCKRQSTHLGKRSDSHSIIRQRSCQTAPQMRSTKGALPNPPASLTGISMIPSETCFPPIREAGYEPIYTSLCMLRLEIILWSLRIN
jgi:hypothetical protein